MNFLKIYLSIIFILLFQQKSYSQFEISANYAILHDHLSGEILYEKDADHKIYPASMTKIMTAIVVFDLLKKGETSLDEKITISEKAWRMSQSGYSSMFIMMNDQVSVEDLLKGIIIVSGNDACLALAEGLSGTEEDFVILMNEKAEEIGLENTNFNNSSGINDANNYSTVRDILIMSRYMIENYPEYYTYFKDTTFTWDRTGGDPITQGNRNPLLYKNVGVDGIKTGYLAVEKYSLASSMKTDKRRLTAVASGFDSKNQRSRQSLKLLTWGLTKFETIKIAEKNTPFTSVDVWQGKKKEINVFVKKDIYETIPKAKKRYIKVKVIYEGPLSAPIEKNEIVAKLNILFKDENIGSYDLFAAESVKRQNIFSRLLTSINYLIWGDV